MSNDLVSNSQLIELKEYLEKRFSKMDDNIEKLNTSIQDQRLSENSIVTRIDTLDERYLSNRTRITELENMNRFYPIVERLVFGMAGTILTIVIGALVYLVIN